MVEKLSTRIASDVERRLRLFAAVRDMTIGEAVTAALDSALPSLRDLAEEVARDATPPQTSVPSPRLTSKEH
ncbi:hypothetical protein [Actinomadura montaniterrae]|uniref:Uncharacterized protein n=1 Tax=Actinomadura montaniterrae TaxID=1803903 RepID=A0A6L3VP90_9ACTN|nr:hypothetical protein [Actinomadura montaniterrae]KAB2376970.1 hypothetical protein F9B16_24350 [Actinomadura montaniterrae]